MELTTGQWVQNIDAVSIGTLLAGGLRFVGSGITAGLLMPANIYKLLCN